MKIGKTVREVPKSKRGTQFDEVWDAASKLADGDILPLQFEDRGAAIAFRTGYGHSARERGLALRLRGSTVYVSRNGRD